MSLPEFSVKRPVTTLMIILSVIVLGVIGLQRLPLTFMPEIESDRLRISIPYPSSSPQEVDRNIARPIEDIMGTLSGLEELNSTSSASSCNISVEFKDGTDMDLAAVEVRDRLDRVRAQLPDDVERINIFRWQSTDMPVFEFSLAWPGRSNDELYEAAEKTLVPQLQRMDGVANVEIRGMDERQVMVELDQERMKAHNLDFFNLSQSLRTNNINVSGGTVIDASKKYSVRVIGEFQTVDEIAQTPIMGTNLVLSDVARVAFDFPEKKEFQRLNNQESLVLRVYKASTANVIDVTTQVGKYIRNVDENPALAGMDVQIFRDQSQEITSSLDNLTYAGIFGGFLAILVLYVFLRKFRTTVIIAMAIPISIIATFLVMYLIRMEPINSGLTLNIVSLSGLMFAIGMLVDPAVVVLENIFRHKQEEGLDGRKAAIIGAREVAVAVTSASLTTIIVFVPLPFVLGSGFGRWFGDFGVTIVSATAASLVIALTVIPLAASRMFTGKEKPPSKLLTRMSEAYGTAIKGITRFPYSLIAVGVFGLVLYGAFELQSKIDRSWMPRTPSRQMNLNAEMDRNFSLAQINTIIDSTERKLIGQKDDLEIATVSTNFSKRRARIAIYFIPEEEAERSTTELYAAVRAQLPEFAGVEFKAGRMRGRGGNEDGVSIELKGKNTDVLITYAEEIRTLMEGIEDVKDVDTSMERGDEEVAVSVDRTRAQKYGLTSQRVAQTISSALTSRSNSKFKTSEREVDILVQLAEEDRVNIQQLQNMTIENSQDEKVQLGSVAELTVRKGPQSIRREDRATTIRIFANTEQSGLWKVNMEIDKMMAGIQLPPGYEWSKGRNWRMMRQAETDSSFALILALIFVYIVMASLFESFIHPFTVLFSVPFALIGVFVMFYWTSTTLSTSGWLGIIVVCGLVVNNGIILVDAINKFRQQGLSRAEAIRRGGRNRLRPILMTTLTTLIGLLPMVVPTLFPEIFGQQEGRAGMYAPIGIAIVGGFLTSTPATLFIMPILYVIFDDLKNLMTRFVAFIYTSKPKPAVAE